MFRAAMLLVIGALAVGPARAQQPQVTEIFKCKGRDGHWTYTNDRREAEKQKCEVVTRQVNAARAQKQGSTPPASKTPRPSEFPKESSSERQTARERQRQILQSQLANEQAALGKARQERATQ